MELEVVVPQDIIEQILIRADVKPLTRFKSVCKSWQSLISGDRFIKAHLNRNYQKRGDTRIVILRDSNMPYNFALCRYYSNNEWNILGSSNGLVCISDPHGQIFVTNPSTKDLKKLPSHNLECSTCWGFGYDSSIDDYKVIVGVYSGFGWMSFQVLSLKTNTWKDVAKLYLCCTIYSVGILYNGKLQWFMKYQNGKDVLILSFDLSEEKFEEISLPGEFKYDPCYYLGIIEECLCICDLHHSPIWVMKNNNVRESWVSLQYPPNNDNDAVHNLRRTKDDLVKSRIIRVRDISCAPIFVHSLVSPHANGKLFQEKETGKNYEKLDDIGVKMAYFKVYVPTCLKKILL